MLDEFDSLVEIISTLPGIGRKSAMRIAFHLLRQSPDQIDSMTASMKGLHGAIALCNVCGCLRSVQRSCEFCQKSTRDKSLLCIVEQPSDVYHIENTQDYRGQYHVLGGVIDPLEGVTPQDLHFDTLLKRVAEGDASETKINEIIVATNPSIEGDATARYIVRLMVPYPYLKVSRIATGMAMGSQLDFADSYIIAQSLRQRISLTG